MAEMRVFVSSTCYDLSLLRAQLRRFIKDMGYEPIMSDYADVLYDPRGHTHTSCVDEVGNCDLLILIIGSRFGGKATPEALGKIDFEALQNESASVESLKEKSNLSVTQLEVLKAVESAIPVYTFIDKNVWHDHALYEKNKASDVIDQIVFPSIEKQETAKYIFNFINFVRLRTRGNNIFTFEKAQDIEEVLKKQWSAYFQRLLWEQRHIASERRRMDRLSEQFEDLKTAILTSIENVDQRETARGIVHYRRMAELLLGLGIPKRTLNGSTESFDDLMKGQGIVDIIDFREIDARPNRLIPPRTILVRYDRTFYEVRAVREMVIELGLDWESFTELPTKTREIILDALAEMVRPSALVRYHEEPFRKYINQFAPCKDADAGDEE